MQMAGKMVLFLRIREKPKEHSCDFTVGNTEPDLQL